MGDDGFHALNGYGRYIDDNIYSQGNYKMHCLHGKGKWIKKIGEVHEGDFKEDILNGEGKILLPNGDIEEGTFVDCELEGNGKRIYLDGKIQIGKFHNGELIVWSNRITMWYINW